MDAPLSYEDITFARSAVSRILSRTIQTIANRELRGLYPEPKRKNNRYRYYTLHDVFHLQEIDYGKLYVGPIAAELYDQGYQDPVIVKTLLDDAIKAYRKDDESESSEL